MKWPLKIARCCLGLILAGSAVAQHPKADEAPEYVALHTSDQPAISGCNVVQSRESLKASLVKLGYTSNNLPKIDFGKEVAVIITSSNGSVTPYTYGGTSDALVVLTIATNPDPKNYLFVMTAGKKVTSLSHCVIRNVFDALDSAPLKWLNGGHSNSSAMVIKSGSSTTAPEQD